MKDKYGYVILVKSSASEEEVVFYRNRLISFKVWQKYCYSSYSAAKKASKRINFKYDVSVRIIKMFKKNDDKVEEDE